MVDTAFNPTEAYYSVTKAPDWAFAIEEYLHEHPEMSIVINNEREQNKLPVKEAIIAMYIGATAYFDNIEKIYNHLKTNNKNDFLIIHLSKDDNQDLTEIEHIGFHPTIFGMLEELRLSEVVTHDDSLKSLDNHKGFVKNIITNYIQKVNRIYTPFSERIAVYAHRQHQENPEQTKRVMKQAREANGRYEYLDIELQTFLVLFNQGVKYSDMLDHPVFAGSEELGTPGRPLSALSRIRDELQIEPRKEHQTWSSDETKLLIELRTEKRLSINEISLILDRSNSSIEGQLYYHKVRLQLNYDEMTATYGTEFSDAMLGNIDQVNSWQALADYMAKVTGEDLSLDNVRYWAKRNKLKKIF